MGDIKNENRPTGQSQQGDVFKSPVPCEQGIYLESPAEVFSQAREKCPYLPIDAYTFTDHLILDYLREIDGAYPSDLVYQIICVLNCYKCNYHPDMVMPSWYRNIFMRMEVLAQASAILQIADIVAPPVYAKIVRAMARIAFDWQVPKRIWIQEDDPDNDRVGYSSCVKVATDLWTAFLQYPMGMPYGPNRFLGMQNPIRMPWRELIRRFSEMKDDELLDAEPVLERSQILAFREKLMQRIDSELREQNKVYLSVNCSYKHLFDILKIAEGSLGGKLDLLPCRMMMRVTLEEVSLTIGDEGIRHTIWRAKSRL